jgi:hypothetical protein
MKVLLFIIFIMSAIFSSLGISTKFELTIRIQTIKQMLLAGR